METKIFQKLMKSVARESKSIVEAKQQWGLRWTEFGKNDRTSKKEKLFDSEAKREAFANKLEKKDNFNSFEAWADPE